MKDKLEKQIREVEEVHAGEILDARLEEHNQSERMRAMFVLGGTHIANKIAASLDSEMMRTLISFQEQKMYEALGFETFVDFLNNSEYSPMTKAQFYERKAIWDKEGEKLFDLLTELGVSVRKRKLLGKGSVAIDGNTVIVTNDGEETAIDLSDRHRIMETISALADANADKSHKLEKQQKAIDGHKEKVTDLYAQIDSIRASKAADIGQDPHSQAILNLNFAYRALIESVADMSPVEQEQFVTRDFELIAARNADLAAAYGRGDWTKIAPATAGAKTESVDDLDALIDQALDEESDPNDAELADSL